MSIFFGCLAKNFSVDWLIVISYQKRDWAYTNEKARTLETYNNLFMSFIIKKAEVQTSVIEEKDNCLSGDSQKGEFRNNADLTGAEVQTSEKPKSELRGGNNEENTKNAEVKTSGIPKSGVLKTDFKTSDKPTLIYC